jgi:arylformamidase
MFQNPIKEVIDLSHEVSENMENISGWTTAFPMMDTIAKTRQLSGGKVGYAARMILISEHTGTHIDAPRHFVEDGMDVASIPVEQLCLPGHLLDLTHRKVGEAITVEDFEEAEKVSGRPVGPGSALICWTGVDKVWGQKNMNRIRPHIPAESAQWMVEKKVTLFATDLIGMDHPDEWHDPTHLAWLENNICMVQQLCHLDKLVQKDFLFCAFPIKTIGGTGCPVRAVALVV